MKLLLSSAGLVAQEVKEEFQKKIESLKSKKLCLICHEAENGFEEWMENRATELKKINSDIEVIVLNLSEEIEADKIPQCDIYYVSRGNTFFILSRMKELGIDKFLQREIENDKFYFGVSTGSMIIGQDIERFSSLWNDENEVGLKNCKGFGLISFDIIPHYMKNQADEVMKYYQENNSPIVALTDNQAILVAGEEMEIIGPEDEGLLLD